MKVLKKRFAALCLSALCLFNCSAAALAEEAPPANQPRTISNGTYSICTSNSKYKVMNCDTNNDFVPAGTKVNIWSYTGNASQRWIYGDSMYGQKCLMPARNTKVSLNCLRGGEYQCNVILQTDNKNTQEDLHIKIGYMSLNSGTIRVNPRDNYTTSYIQIRNAKCIWTTSAAEWYFIK